MTYGYRTHPDWAALCRKIGERPADDTVRLVAADWLEERAGDARCDFCAGTGRFNTEASQPEWAEEDCPTCHGTGRVSNGCADRAAFIRVQCELYRAKFDPLASSSNFGELLAQHSRLADKLGHVAFGVSTSWAMYYELAPHNKSRALAHVQRGFITTVRGPLSDLIGGPCGRCDGNGRLFIAVRSPTDSDSAYCLCPDCAGTGRTAGHLAKIGVELLLVERAEASGSEPWVNLDRTHWGWWERTIHSGPDTLPPDLMDDMDDDPRRYDYGIGVARRAHASPGGCILFASEAHARAALSRAILSVCRERAGL